MSITFNCPACGHPHRITDAEGQRQAMCLACGEIFRVRPGKQNRDADKPKSAMPDWPTWTGVVQTFWGDGRAALDGAIPGALGGICAGILVGILAGLLAPESAEPVGGPVGEILKRVSEGVALGFGLGALLGCLVTINGRQFHPGRGATPGRIALRSGAIAGAAVGLVVGNWLWMLGGAAIGAGVASLWAMLCYRVESAMASEPLRIESSEVEEEGAIDSPPPRSLRHASPWDALAEWRRDSDPELPQQQPARRPWPQKQSSDRKAPLPGKRHRQPKKH
jgi:hypothetical protein